MVKASSEQDALAPVPSLPLIKRVNDIQKDRGNNFCHIRYPQPKTRIIDSGQPYQGRKAYLVLTGEIKEFITVVDDSGKKYRIKSKSFEPGSIVFPQALEIKLACKDSLASYWVGDHSTSIVELHHDLIMLLGYSADMISFEAHSEHKRIEDQEKQTRMIRAFFSKRCSDLEEELQTIRYTLHTRTQSLQTAEEKTLQLEQELKQSRTDNCRLSELVLSMERRLEQEIPPVSIVNPNDEIKSKEEEIAELSDDDIIEITQVGVAPPSIPPMANDEDSKPTQTPPPSDAEGDSRRDTLDYLQVAPFVGLHGGNELTPPLPQEIAPSSEYENVHRTLTIPLPSGVKGVAELLKPQEPEDMSEPDEQRRMTLIHPAVRPANILDEDEPPPSISIPLSRRAPLRVPSIKRSFDPNEP